MSQDWSERRAIEEYQKLGNSLLNNERDTNWLRAFARYIAEHEEPPVDPLQEIVEEALLQFYKTSQRIGWPGTDLMAKAVVKALREHGMELAK